MRPSTDLIRQLGLWWDVIEQASGDAMNGEDHMNWQRQFPILLTASRICPIRGNIGEIAYNQPKYAGQFSKPCSDVWETSRLLMTRSFVQGNSNFMCPSSRGFRWFVDAQSHQNMSSCRLHFHRFSIMRSFALTIKLNHHSLLAYLFSLCLWIPQLNGLLFLFDTGPKLSRISWYPHQVPLSLLHESRRFKEEAINLAKGIIKLERYLALRN